MDESENPLKDGLELKEMSTEIDMTEEIREHIISLPHDSSYREFEGWLTNKRVMIPDKNRIFSEAREIWGETISTLIPTKVYSKDHDKPVGSYDPGDSVLAFREKQHYLLNLKLVDQLNKTTQEHYIRPFVSQRMFAQVLTTHPIANSHSDEIEDALEAYYGKKYSSAIRLLLPEFERLIREFVKNEGGEITRKVDEGKYETKSLATLLDTDFIQSYLDKDERFYFKALLCESTVYNMRNKDLHGLSVDKQQQQALRILWSYGYLTKKLRNYDRWQEE